LIVFAIGVAIGFSGFRYLSSKKSISTDEAKELLSQFMAQQGYEGVTVKEVSDEGGSNYKVLVDAQGREFVSYITKDGKQFFQMAVELDEVMGNESGATPDAPFTEVSVKSERPNIELFVMSHCPFGTQVEKGLLPVLDLLGDSVAFNLKFVNYAMHGEKEINEQLTQYCIQRDYPGQLLPYLGCFLADETMSSACVAELGIDEWGLNNCVQQSDTEYKITESFGDNSTWKGTYPPFSIYEEDNTKYGVSGSPTLVINEQLVESGRDSASLLSVVCSAFENRPVECDTELSSEAPSAGFGFNTGGPTSDASCGD